jgi:hypothetical protein
MSRCPYCNERPIGARGVTCGAPVCRRDRKLAAGRKPASAAIPECLTCRACRGLMHWPGTGRRPHYCTDATCRRTRSNDRAYQYYLRSRWKGGTVGERRTTPTPALPALSTHQPGPVTATVTDGYREPDAVVERMLAQARAARLAEERRNGQRRYTIETGWQQKGGAGQVNIDIGTRWTAYQ